MKHERDKDFTLVLLSGENWFKLRSLMLSHGMPSHIHIGACCPVSATKVFGPILFSDITNSRLYYTQDIDF